MTRKARWKNKKYAGLFIGSYERDKAGERIFVLTGGKRRIVFESHESAKKNNWQKIKKV